MFPSGLMVAQCTLLIDYRYSYNRLSFARACLARIKKTTISIIQLISKGETNILEFALFSRIVRLICQ